MHLAPRCRWRTTNHGQAGSRSSQGQCFGSQSRGASGEPIKALLKETSRNPLLLPMARGLGQHRLTTGGKPSREKEKAVRALSS